MLRPAGNRGRWRQYGVGIECKLSFPPRCRKRLHSLDFACSFGLAQPVKRSFS
ncbi:hypothetical protein GCM10027343_40250 [Noviherbaspirillum agri]